MFGTRSSSLRVPNASLSLTLSPAGSTADSAEVLSPSPPPTTAPTTTATPQAAPLPLGQPTQPSQNEPSDAPPSDDDDPFPAPTATPRVPAPALPPTPDTPNRPANTPPTFGDPPREADDPPPPETPDSLLTEAYGATIHSTSGALLDGGVADSSIWCRRWKRLVQLPLSSYNVPRGNVGRRFLERLTGELAMVRQRQTNSERVLVFAMTVLVRTPGVLKASDIRRRLTNRLDLWRQGRFSGLVEDTEREGLARAQSYAQADDETLARRFDATVRSGRLRQAVRCATDRGQGGVLYPDDADTKTGRPVIDVLRDKHPPLRHPPANHFRSTVFERYDSMPEVVPLDITEKDVEHVASRLSGAAGPSGVDAVALRNWALRFGTVSEALRTELAAWVNWLGNTSPPFAAYRAMMACRLVALDKCPGVRPVGIGEIFRRLFAKCVMKTVGPQATAACGSVNLCAGLAAGIEGAVHAIRDRWESPPDPTDTSATIPPPVTQPPAPSPSPSADPPDDPDTPPPEALILVDAKNGFNELSRLAMMWTVRHLWPAGSRFAFNCYRHAAQLILRRPGGKCEVLLSREGVTQGDPLSMVLYGVMLIPLGKTLRRTAPGVLQPWYADDFSMLGPATDMQNVMRQLMEEGPPRGYYPEPSKSIVVCRAADEDTFRHDLDEFSFSFCRGSRYVGGFVGDDNTLQEWLTPKLENWRHGVRVLARIARRYPQSAFAGLRLSLQNEWQYLQRVLPDSSAIFQPLADAITEDFLPALFGATPEEIANLRDLFELGPGFAGLGLPCPTKSGPRNHRMSIDCTKELCKALKTGKELNTASHCRAAREARLTAAKERSTAQRASLETILATHSPADKRRLERACATGVWLSVMPDDLNGTTLSAEEFRDNLRLRYGLKPLDLPELCDGCGAKFSAEHALSCKKGGLVTLRHDDLAIKWHDLCAKATKPSAVSYEPLIYTRRPAAPTAAPPDAPATEPDLLPEDRGDVACHGFWKRGTTTIFDLRVVDLGAPTYRGSKPQKVLARHEKDKKKKYLDACLERRRHFTPMVYSVDGMTASETSAAHRKLASLLSTKWKRTYPAVCCFVRSRMALALARSTTICLRGCRDPTARIRSPEWESGSGMSLYRTFDN